MGTKSSKDRSVIRKQQDSILCNPQLRDPMTLALSYMPNPGLFRPACRFTAECWEHAKYLEVVLYCPQVWLEDKKGVPMESNTTQQPSSRLLRCCPFVMERIYRLPISEGGNASRVTLPPCHIQYTFTEGKVYWFSGGRYWCTAHGRADCAKCAKDFPLTTRDKTSLEKSSLQALMVVNIVIVDSLNDLQRFQTHAHKCNLTLGSH